MAMKVQVIMENRKHIIMSDIISLIISY